MTHNYGHLKPQIHVMSSLSSQSCFPVCSPCRYRALTFILTFLLYTSFHLSRKPISIVKVRYGIPETVHGINVCSTQPRNRNSCLFAVVQHLLLNHVCTLLQKIKRTLLQMFVAVIYIGIIGERLPIRLYLTVGMLASGVFTCLFGLGYIYNIHNLSFYIFVQVANGLVQTTGWPSVVTCIGNWFGKGRRGLIMGLWNSHTSVGNILGSLIAGYWVSSNWGMSFIVPGLIIIIMGVVCFLFLIERKYTVWWSGYGYRSLLCSLPQSYDTELLLPRDSERIPMQPVVVVKSESEPSAISFMGALRIPGVVEFSLCLLFAKLVSYTFLFWLPLYITKAAHLDAKKAGDLSTLFDVGGIVGGILAGVISDKLGKRATTCAVMLLLAAPTLYGFSMISQFGLGPTIGMLLVCGGLVNGPYALITTAVSADLGTHKSLKGNARALSTVTAIIDGTGSVGAALGPLLAGLLSAGGWDQVFYMLMTADFLALLVRPLTSII
uniref:Solute carrier family 37 member 1 n=1 Tax=Oreochromis niloticus TaxID=8128 RepID=A0A669EYW7_ORENI